MILGAARLVTNVLLAITVLRVWHILLLRLFLDEPLTVAAWLLFSDWFSPVGTLRGPCRPTVVSSRNGYG